MLRKMRQHREDRAGKDRHTAEERRLQTGAALLLGVVVLIVIVLRAGVHNVFMPGWWRH